MPSLYDVQARFAEGLVGNDDAILRHVRSHAFPREQLFQIYRNHGTATLTGALGDIYPVVRRLVGDAFFDFAAHRYLREYLPADGNLHDYGDRFAPFLAGFEPARAVACLADVARLEWAWHRAFHAAEAELLPLSALARVDPGEYPALRFVLHPSVSLVASPYPLLRIWQVNQPEFEGDQTVDLAEGGARLLVIRRGLTVEIEPLGHAEFVLLSALADGSTLECATAAAAAVQPDFALGETLQRHVAERTISGFSVRGGEDAT